MALQISRSLRSVNVPPKHLWMPSGAIAIPDSVSARVVAQKFQLPASELRALSLIDDASRIIIDLYRQQLSKMLRHITESAMGTEKDRSALADVLKELALEFPPPEVFDGIADASDWLESSSQAKDGKMLSHREAALEQLILVRLFNENPACVSYRPLFDDGVSPAGTAAAGSLAAKTPYLAVFLKLEEALKALPGLSYEKGKALDLISFLREPAKRAPQSLKAQLQWIVDNWGELLGDFRLALLAGIDMINEETAPRFPAGSGAGARIPLSQQPA
jgi:hypothetical protein